MLIQALDMLKTNWNGKQPFKVAPFEPAWWCILQFFIFKFEIKIHYSVEIMVMYVNSLKLGAPF